ncbi:hypothetical protein LCGC14_1641810 [marine sediment metagenome]|uniref:Uncharacterized protein n=1 Tax=marine sediment metagenome TaxID=412755 RepID=A0A0F9KF77_9ZZZZ
MAIQRITPTMRPRSRAGGTLAEHSIPCQRCGVEAELGRCPFCHRDLCVTCYDGDQEKGPCRAAPIEQRDDAIRALHGSLSVGEIAEQFNLSRRRIFTIVA